MKLLKYIRDKQLPKDKNVEHREACRAVLFDENNTVPLLFVSKYNYHKLPGGGVKEGEDKITALGREIAEETGCKIIVENELGEITEYRSKFNLLQISRCFMGRVVGKGKTNFTKKEKRNKFKLIWVSLNKAITLLKKDKPDNYEGKFIQERDLTFLKQAKIVRLDSEKETEEILKDKKLMRSIRKAEKEFAEGKGLDWEDVKKELKINV